MENDVGRSTVGRPEPGGPAHAPVPPPTWIGRVWGALWIGFAVLNILPGNSPVSTIDDQLATNGSMAPAWLASFDGWVGTGVHSVGKGAGVLVVGLELAIGLAAWQHGRLHRPAIWTGIVLTGVYWAAGQSFGELFSGQATDPNTGPLLVLIGLAALSTRARPSTAVTQRHSAGELRWRSALHADVA